MSSFLPLFFLLFFPYAEAIRYEFLDRLTKTP